MKRFEYGEKTHITLCFKFRVEEWYVITFVYTFSDLTSVWMFIFLRLAFSRRGLLADLEILRIFSFLNLIDLFST